MDARRLIMGDWGRVVRDPLDLLRILLVLGAVASLVAGEGSGAVYLLVSSAGAIVARLVDLPRVIDLAMVLALCITGFGEALGFYDRWGWFDRVVHVVVPMLFAPTAYIALARGDLVLDPADQVPDVRRGPALFLLTFALGVALGALWEIVEYVADAAGLSNLSESNGDTVGDLIADTCGSLAGAALLLLWTFRGWGSVRRLPGDNRREALG